MPGGTTTISYTAPAPVTAAHQVTRDRPRALEDPGVSASVTNHLEPSWWTVGTGAPANLVNQFQTLFSATDS